MGVTATFKALVDAKYEIDDTIVVPTSLVKRDNKITMQDGTGTDQADVIYAKRHTIAGGATLTLDVEDGSIDDPLGQPVQMDRVKALIVADVSDPVQSGADVGGGAAANDIVGNTTPLRAGGTIMIVAPDATAFAAAAGSTDEITVTNNDPSNAIEVDIIIVGASA